MTTLKVDSTISRIIASRMPSAEWRRHERLIRKNLFDATRLVSNGYSPYYCQDRRFIFHFSEGSLMGSPIPFQRGKKPIEVNVFDYDRRRHIGFVTFLVEGSEAFSSYRIFREYFKETRLGCPLGSFLNNESLGSTPLLDANMHANALEVGQEYRNMGFGLSLIGLATFIARRVYGMESFRWMAASAGPADRLYRHLFNVANVSSQVKIVRGENIVSFSIPLAGVDDHLAFVRMKEPGIAQRILSSIRF